MKRSSASVMLLMVLVLPAVVGCQVKAKGVEEGLYQTGQRTAAQGAVNLTLQHQDEQAALQGQQDKAAYGIGLDVARNLLRQEPKLNPDSLLLGLRDGLQKNKPLVPDEEMGLVRRAFLAERMLADAKLMGPHAEKNLLEGEAFLKANARKEGVRTLASGLQYRVIKEGSGKSPGIDKDVEAHYIVKTIDGAELENTYKGEPAVLPLRGIIPAWVEAMQLMKEGARWEVFAPSYLAYGEMGTEGGIGPYQAMVFEIELLKVR